MSVDHVDTNTSGDELRRIVKDIKKKIHYSIERVANEVEMSYATFQRWLNGPRTLKPDERARIVSWISRKLPKKPLEDATARMRKAIFLTTTNTLNEASRLLEKHGEPICIQDNDGLKGVLTKEVFDKIKNALPETLLRDFVDVLEQYPKVSHNMANRRIDFLLKGESMVLVERDGIVIGTIPRVESKHAATSYRGPELDEFGPTYAEVEVPRQVATELIDLLERYSWIRKGMKVLDVGTGPLNFPRVLFERELELFEEECINIVAAEHQNACRWKTIAEDIKREIGSRLIEIRFDGLEDLVQYGNKFDLVVWNLTTPTIKGLGQLSKLLGNEGKVAISCYHEDTLREFYTIFEEGLVSEGQTFDWPEEMYDIEKLADMVSAQRLEIEEGTFHRRINGYFKNPNQLLSFLSSSLAPAGTIFFHYPTIRKKVEENALKSIERKYGSKNPTVRFKMIFLLGIKPR